MSARLLLGRSAGLAAQEGVVRFVSPNTFPPICGTSGEHTGVFVDIIRGALENDLDTVSMESLP
jgi:hypothetical protein